MTVVGLIKVAVFMLSWFIVGVVAMTLAVRWDTLTNEVGAFDLFIAAILGPFAFYLTWLVWASGISKCSTPKPIQWFLEWLNRNFMG